MHYTLGMQIHQSLKKLTHYYRSSLLSYVFSDYFLEELASLAELKNQYVTGFVVVHLEESSNVGVVESYHDGHLCE